MTKNLRIGPETLVFRQAEPAGGRCEKGG